jgi:hypothetical protein
VRVLRGGLVTIAAALALSVVPTGGAAPTAATTYKCNQVWASFYIQLIGDRDWGWNLGGLGHVGAPTKKSMIIVHSLGGPKEQQGLNAYSWSTATRSRASSRCTTLRKALKAPSLTGLGPVTRVKDGWAFGRKFACAEPGALLITTSPVPGGTKVVVRLQRSGRVLAVGEVAKGGGWIRGSTRCDSREK